MQPLRRKFINHLRTNPDKRDQIDCMLTNGLNGRCAMGLGLEGIGIDIAATFAASEEQENGAYHQGAKQLGFGNYAAGNMEKFDLVWRLNDRGMSFQEIADRLETEWDND